MYGLSHASPAAHTAEYVQVLQNAADLSGRVAFDGNHFTINAMLEVAAGRPFPILMAALGSRMLEAAGTVADGTITTWCDERALGEHIVPRITTAAERAGRPSPWVVCCLSVAVVDDADAAKQEVAPLFAGFGRIPAYKRMFDLATSPEPANIAVIGDERTVRARLAAFEAVGVTDFCAAPMAIGSEPLRFEPELSTCSRSWSRNLSCGCAPEDVPVGVGRTKTLASRWPTDLTDQNMDRMAFVSTAELTKRRLTSSAASGRAKRNPWPVSTFSAVSCSRWSVVLDTLGNGLEPERFAQLDHCVHEGRRLGGVGHPRDEGPVDLEHVDGELPQIGQ